MRLLHPYTVSPSPAVAAAALLCFLDLSSLAQAQSWHCETVAGGVKFDFHALQGTHEITSLEETSDGNNMNTTWQINPCGPITRKKDVETDEQCPAGTQICGIERILNGFHRSIPIAEGRVDADFVRLRSSDSNAEVDKEGLRAVLTGTTYKGRKQKAIIEFLCDPDRVGDEGAKAKEPSDDEEKRRRRREEKEGTSGDEGEDDDKGDGDDKDDGGEKKPQGDASLRFIRYDTPEGSDKDKDTYDTLRLEWRTKYACEGIGKGGDGEKGSHWGFFTWFIIILFLGVAAYLIFGSWLNYNRYGATGWDLLPHGDTIRDIPYLLKDWFRRVIGTLQGRGAAVRGGYSAV